MEETMEIERVAVIGMAGRFPGARNLEELWSNLREGKESIRDLSDEELRAAGVDPASIGHPAYVRRAASVADPDLFDAGFFGFSPREAELLDPQQRLFLECAWEALESAGCVALDYPGWIAVYAGISPAVYMFQNLFTRPDVVASAGGSFPLLLANDRDYFATRISYKLNLKGISVNVQTACSTSLVAVHMACQSLLAYQCDVALAGGVRVGLPLNHGYMHQEGSIFSPEGRCRAFDASANGSIFGDGMGAVVLKRLSDALRDGDDIQAVILGSAVNNDGSFKVGYTAPSVEGQAEVIAMAHQMADVGPETITYVETHGSGTPLGDPIEVRALTQAFRNGTDAKGFCAIGSIKTNIGHVEAAAGIAGFLKTVLALKHRELPPSLHFERPNPQCGFEESPFYVNASLSEWKSDGSPRRAGVSSFGMGGTNVHIVLEEAPEPEPSGPSRPWQLLVLSARTETALEASTDRLAEALGDRPEGHLADVAHTLQVGRRGFEHRRVLVCRDLQDAREALASRDPRRVLTGLAEAAQRPVSFLFPGVGDHYPGMGRGLYDAEPTFREVVDQCADLLRDELGLDLREALFPEGSASGEEGGVADFRALLRAGAGRGPGADRLDRTAVAQPAVFVLDYALARLWMEWGVRPASLIGYSLGEYVAACVAGVLSLEDALGLVARRARMIEELPEGAMLAVPLPEAEAARLLGPDLWLAAVNGPHLSVISGTPEAVAALEDRLTLEGVSHRRLPARHAFHSGMMEPIRAAFTELVAGVELRAPEIPYLSNVTGGWITAEEATDPGYWARHLCGTVRFASGLEELCRDPLAVLIEAGPGRALGTLALQAGDAAPVVLASLRSVHERQPDVALLLESLGRYWLAGGKVDWAGFAAHEKRRRLTLPTYPFERRRYWIDAPAFTAPGIAAAPAPEAADAGRERALHARPANLRNPYVAPTTAEEGTLAAIWQDVLGVAEVGIHDDFFQLGGHSLLAPQLLLRLREAFGIDLPIPVLFQAPTVAGLAEALEQAKREGGFQSFLDAAVVDLPAEVALDDAIRPAGPLALDVSDPAAVFLTGASGFLGSYLLVELLRQTRATVHCLVRAADPAEGERRLRQSLEKRRLWDGAFAPRIVAVPGDLAEPLFGLSEEDFRELAARVEAVYHCGAWVNFTYPYSALKPTNVGGTVEAIRLASLERAKPLHFVSSISVFSPLGAREGTLGREDDPLEESRGLFSGYAEAKWVAEKILGLARDRGLPASVYRPGVIAGDSRTGVGNTSDLAWNMIKGAIQLQAAPRDEEAFDVAPVDYVARAIVALSLRREGLGLAYHFPNPRPLSWNRIYDYVRELGYPLRQIPMRRWLEEVYETVGRNPGHALAPFAPMLSAGGTADLNSEALSEEAMEAFQAELSGDQSFFDGSNTLSGLAGSGVTCPPVEDLLPAWFSYFIESGFLESPEGTAVAIPAGHGREGRAGGGAEA